MSASAPVEVWIELDGQTHRVGLLRIAARRGGEALTFEYDAEWRTAGHAFDLEPALRVGPGPFPAPQGRPMFGSLGDSAPDTWGRRLMQRAERRLAETEGRAPRTLMESDYLLGVTDVARLGALRFRRQGQEDFQAPLRTGVPGYVELGRLLGVTERIARGEESDEDLALIFAPGSSLGGARPKASVMDQHAVLSIAKFPKEDDDYGIETWECVALRLAEKAGIRVAGATLETVAGKPVLLSRRFDRRDGTRVPFLSALSMLELVDGERGSYPEIADALVQHGANPERDVPELFRRVVFNVLVSNVDDHLRNHGFLWTGSGWELAPAYDLNPVPVDVKPRILSTAIDLTDHTCSVELLRSAAEYYNLTLDEADAVIGEVGAAVARWREEAARLGIRPREIDRMASAFEHADLERATR